MADSVLAFILPTQLNNWPGRVGEHGSLLAKWASKAAQLAADHPVYAAGGAVVVSLAAYYRLR